MPEGFSNDEKGSGVYVQNRHGGRPFEVKKGADPLAQQYDRLTEAEYKEIMEIHAERVKTITDAYHALGASDAEMGDIAEKNFWSREPQKPVGIVHGGKYQEVKFLR